MFTLQRKEDWYETMSYDYEVQLQVEIDNFKTYMYIHTRDAVSFLHLSVSTLNSSAKTSE